jgi:hypothetical protein
MKTKLLPLILIMSPALACAQFRPIIDSTIFCSYGYEFTENLNDGKKILEFFYIVEEMPKSKIPVSEIESMLERTIRLNAQEKNYNGIIFLQCIINCKGQAGDYQINDCPTEFINIGCQVLNAFRESIISWGSPKQRGHDIDLLTRVKVTINQGQFKVVAPYF